MKENSLFLKLILVVTFMFVIDGCGNNETVTAPYGSIIAVQPSDYTVTDASFGSSWSDAYFTITVLDPTGSPMNNVEIFIDYVWALPDPGSSVLILYSGNDETGYAAENAPMKAVTDNSGNYHLRVQFLHGGGLEYSGDIQIISAGAQQGAMSFAVSAD